MANWDLVKELDRLETLLEHGSSDFSAAYMLVQSLHSLIRSHPQIIRPKTVSALKHLLGNSKHTSQKMSFFLYKEAADALVSVLVHTLEEHLADQTLAALRHIISTVSGIQQRATAEALGSLPLIIHGPEICGEFRSNIPQVTWERILAIQGINPCDPPKLIGRSIVAKHHKKDSVLVIKTADAGDALYLINREAQWMEALKFGGYSFPIRFDIPRPIKIDGSFMFRLQNPPLIFSETTDADQQCYAIGFIAHKDYFCYPNDHENNWRLTREDFREILFRNAWLLGKLTAMGVVHSAPIPLFHNRTQQTRRTDHGLYEWPRGGRLDRWLYTCRYPNFGLTGLRDFEHFVAAEGSGRKIYRQIGTHILSLLLVAGSYFRNQDAARYGTDGCGKPVDARDLFDKPFFKELTQGVFLNYYSGFAKETFQGKIPVNFDELVSRMIDAMGIDRHMEEILRVLDQSEMTDEEFGTFLEQNGLTYEEIAQLEKGRQDITLQTGPHLGGFNERISIPELTDFLSATSAFCVAGKYKHQQSLRRLR